MKDRITQNNSKWLENKVKLSERILPTGRHPCFEVVLGLAWSHDPEIYASGSVATGRISHAGQVKEDDPDKKGYPGPQGW
jgi:hypothetical protein